MTAVEFANNQAQVCGRSLSLDAMMRVGLEGVFMNCQHHEILYLKDRVNLLEMQIRLAQTSDS